eukprot:gene16761-31437_t
MVLRLWRSLLLAATVSVFISADDNTGTVDVTITQAGDWEWKMVADVEDIVSSTDATWPTLTIKQGSAVKFVGTVEDTHQFAIKDADGADVAGPSDLAKGEAVTYALTWTADVVGNFIYYCPPHASIMKGDIKVVSSEPEQPLCKDDESCATSPPTAELCSGSLGSIFQKTCPVSCNACPTTTSTTTTTVKSTTTTTTTTTTTLELPACTKVDDASCKDVTPEECQMPIIQNVCEAKCLKCNANAATTVLVTSTTTTVPSTTTTTTTLELPACTKVDDASCKDVTPEQCQMPVIQNVCEAKCLKCNANAATAEVTTTTSAATTTTAADVDSTMPASILTTTATTTAKVRTPATSTTTATAATKTTTVGTEPQRGKDVVLTSNLEMYPGMASRGPVGSGSVRVSGDTGGGDVTFQYTLLGINPTLATSVGSYPETSAAISGRAAVEDVGNGKIKIHYDLSNIPTNSEAGTQGPLAASIGTYPGSTSDYVPRGSVSAADNANNGVIDFRWSLENMRPTLKATLGSYPGSTAAVAPTGTVAVEDQPDGSIKVYYDITGGFDENAAGGGLHIHTGTSCSSA